MLQSTATGARPAASRPPMTENEGLATLDDQFRLTQEGFVPPPRRIQMNIASLPLTNLGPANDLRRRGEAKSTEYRPTEKIKKFSGAKSMSESVVGARR